MVRQKLRIKKRETAGREMWEKIRSATRPVISGTPFFAEKRATHRHAIDPAPKRSDFQMTCPSSRRAR